jgi:hypothetical protein
MFTAALPLVLGGIAALAIGTLWYSPMMFGPQWMKLMGMKKKDMKPSGDMVPMMLGTLLAEMLMGYVLWSMMMMLGVAGPAMGAQLAFLLWLGFVVTTSLVNAIYAKTPMKLFLINVGYHLASLVVMGIVFGWLG